MTQTEDPSGGGAASPRQGRWDLLLPPPIPPSIRVFSNESVLRIRWPKYRETASSEVRGEGREPLADKAGESTLLSRSGGEKGLR